MIDRPRITLPIPENVRMKPRLLTCNSCNEQTELHEPQGPFTDPATFRCLRCLEAAGDPQTLEPEPARQLVAAHDPYDIPY